MAISTLNHFTDIEKKELEKGIFLWITHADKIPPHIGISVNGNYFSIKVNGKDDCKSSLIFRTIQQKKIPSIFVKLDDVTFSTAQFEAIKNEYFSVKEGVETCLIPILDLYDVKEKSFLLHDFLKHLNEKQHILAYFALNLPSDFQGIQNYTLEDVTKHLKKIKHAERTKRIS